jgi:hypothetical protein
MSLSKYDYREQLLEQLRSIDVKDLKSNFDLVATSNVIEEQKIYFWIRLYLNEELSDIIPGDDITISWSPSDEKLVTKFICFGKNGLEKDHNGEVTNYNPEDDKRILCLMVDENYVNLSEDIPFIRTLFKTGRHYEYQLVKRNELLFTNNRTSEILEYYDCDF